MFPTTQSLRPRSLFMEGRHVDSRDVKKVKSAAAGLRSKQAYPIGRIKLMGEKAMNRARALQIAKGIYPVCCQVVHDCGVIDEHDVFDNEVELTMALTRIRFRNEHVVIRASAPVLKTPPVEVRVTRYDEPSGPTQSRGKPFGIRGHGFFRY